MVYKSKNIRQKIVEILIHALYKKKSIKSLITDELPEDFKPVDRAFLLEVVYGVLRNLFYIDYLLEGFFHKKTNLPPATINNLRCAIYQIVFMRVPDYAVTNEAVNIEKVLKGKPHLVNAILRQFLKSKPDLSIHADNILSYLSIKYSHPEWLIKRWQNKFNLQELEAFLKANNKKPSLTIAVKPEEREKIIKYLGEKGFEASKTKYSPSGILIQGHGMEIRDFLIKEDFFWTIQDEASQLVCYFAEPYSESRLLDACSSPGGKALLSAALMKKGKIVCIEKNEHRFHILKNNIERAKKFLPDIEFELKMQDIFDFSGKIKFNRIILDAPCSSLGTIRRNPDVRYRCNEKEISKLSEKQKLLLDKLSNFLSADGIIVYSVCSTEPEEGEEVIKTFLQKHQEFCTINSNYSFFKDFYIGEGMVRTYPHKNGMDGFFMARLTRRKE